MPLSLHSFLHQNYLYPIWNYIFFLLKPVLSYVVNQHQLLKINKVIHLIPMEHLWRQIFFSHQSKGF
jgi:hypothetical protein